MRISTLILCCALALFAAPLLRPTTCLAAQLPASPPLETMVGQMIMTGFRGTGQSPLSPDLILLLEDIRAGRIGGVIFFDLDWATRKRGRNIVSAAQVKQLTTLLQEKSPIPLFIAVDQEGGRVRRLSAAQGVPDGPSAAELGKKSPADTRAAAEKLGKALRNLGINCNFAPVADLASNPDSPAIGKLGRAFSADPHWTAEHARAFAQGLGDARVASSYKHFPGHGSATADTHLGLTDITRTWRPEELIPYQAVNLPQDTPLMMMTGHLFHKDLDPELPASLSRRITTDLLRKKLGWQGVVITDDVQMNAVRHFFNLEDTLKLAVLAGADIVLAGNNLDHSPDLGRKMYIALLKLVREGKIPEERIRESWLRIKALKESVL